MYLNNKDLTTLQAPNVTVYCWHGNFDHNVNLKKLRR